jgi:hypothetical protein
MQNGVQRYFCNACECTFSSSRRKTPVATALLHDYVWKRQTLAQLAKASTHSARWVRAQIDHANDTERPLTPQRTVLAADTTFWGRQYGVVVLRSPTLKKNLWWAETTQETPDVYARGYAELITQGWNITAVVLDGKRGIPKVFAGIPLQLCQFHQVKTINTYLTRKPQTIAAQELRAIALTLARTDEATFTAMLTGWEKHHRAFLNEHTFCGYCKRKHYVHRRLRSAYRSLHTNLPYLFTYQKYPELNIPNTTNCLDGMFSQLKNRLAVHRGLSKTRRYKIISAILEGERK